MPTDGWTKGEMTSGLRRGIKRRDCNFLEIVSKLPIQFAQTISDA